MKKTSLLLVTALALLIAACAPQAAEMPKAELPAGKAWADGKEIYFIHTEASDAAVAEKLTDMMASPVMLVPSLANVPDESLANVYVFTNGIEGMGPFGFQSDVFDNPPGTDGYTPLRRLNVVTWTDQANARELTHVDDVLAAEAAGEMTIEQPGVVINMPFVVWNGGQR
ncbi:MAG: hypothetical protein QY332_19275 [Anaerolineales bacterium]|nr:MAG: hypothetical protein QY332_19275 [Anaerolineales bacterium]